MIFLTSIFLWLPCSFLLCLFSFFIGRCTRKLPIVDDALPWTMSRSRGPYITRRSSAARADSDIESPGTARTGSEEAQ